MANYIGNNDFRGYVNYLSKNAGDSVQRQGYANLLGIVGNDGGLNFTNFKGLDSPFGYSVGANGGQKLAGDVAKLYGQYLSTSAADAKNADFARQLALINAAKTPVPRMINFDIGGSWNKAREMATNAVSPIYQQKLNKFISDQNTALQRQRDDTTAGKSALDTALNQFIEDANTTRARTTEDTANNINDINTQQAAGERVEGLSFDAANRALNENLGASGTADTGLGQGQVDDAQMARRLQTTEQLRQSNEKVEAAHTLMDRTFQDLDTGTTRKTTATTEGKAKLDLNLERFIQDQSSALEDEKFNENLQKEADIAQQSIGYQGQLVDQWLATLSGKGYTAQEIANAANIYK